MREYHNGSGKSTVSVVRSDEDVRAAVRRSVDLLGGHRLLCRARRDRADQAEPDLPCPAAAHHRPAGDRRGNRAGAGSRGRTHHRGRRRGPGTQDDGRLHRHGRLQEDGHARHLPTARRGGGVPRRRGIRGADRPGRGDLSRRAPVPQHRARGQADQCAGDEDPLRHRCLARHQVLARRDRGCRQVLEVSSRRHQPEAGRP